ncbi:Uncharacterized protein ABC855_g3613 [[Candida] zeylanoides]
MSIALGDIGGMLKSLSIQCHVMRFASRAAAPRRSNVRAKLGHFIETGEIARGGGGRRGGTRGAFDANLSKQKTLLLLQSNYEGKLEDASGKMIDTRRLKVADLDAAADTNRHIFDALLQVAKLSKKPVSKRLLMSLLDVPMARLDDEYMVTKEVLKLLERDNDAARATWLARASTGSTVAMNEITRWHLERGDAKQALRAFNDRKKWRIAPNSQTYVILFDGLAKSHAYGGVPDVLARQAVAILESLMQSTDEVRCSIEHFNACLNLVVRNFSDNQAMAWALFDLLVPDREPQVKMARLYPNIGTYTTLLAGVKKFCHHRAKAVRQERQMPREEKYLRQLELDAKLIATSELILGKVMRDALPPTPPTREEADANPALLESYRAQIRRPILEVDDAFVGLFASCYVNNSSGTGAHEASHYRYIAKGLNYLALWCTEARPMFAAIGLEVEPSDATKRDTDRRLEAAVAHYKASPFAFEIIDGSLNDVLPTSVVPDVAVDAKFNPLVVFPPPILSKNKTRAIFAAKRKPLVDLTRPSNQVYRAIVEDTKYHKSRGKFGRKLSKPVSMTKDPINRFIYGLLLEGVLRLGWFKQFEAAMWYGLARWGGCAGTDAAHNDNVVDVLMVENFLYKIAENSPHGVSSSALAVKVVSTLLDRQINPSQSLVPRFKTIDAVFAILTKELYHLKDSNYNYNRRAVPEVPTARKTLTRHQLATFGRTLTTLMDALAEPRDDVVVPRPHVESFVNFVERLRGFGWPTDCDAIHVMLVRAGIAMYMPSRLIDKRKTAVAHSNTALQPSMDHLIKTMNSRSDLSPSESQLLKWLKVVANFDGEPGDKLHSIIAKIKAECDALTS